MFVRRRLRRSKTDFSFPVEFERAPKMRIKRARTATAIRPNFRGFEEKRESLDFSCWFSEEILLR